MNTALKKLKDVKFYLENYTKIRYKQGGLGSFVLKEAQKDLFNTLKYHNRVMILKARQLGFCLSEDTLVLLSSLKWVKIKDVKIGDYVIAVDENFPGQRKQRKMKTAIVENKFSFKAKTLKITLDDGRVLIGTPEHKMLSKKWECSTETKWKTLGDMEVGTSIRHITNTWKNGNYEDGWLGGMLDGEGSLSKPSRTGTSLNVSQVEGHVLQRLFKYVKDNNITYRVETDDRKCGESSKLGSKAVYKVVVNKMDELFKIIGKTRPSRFLLRKWWENKALPNDGWSKVVSIEDGGMRNVVDLQTSEKTYIANGFVSHNSTAVVGFFYHKTIMNSGVTTVLVGYNQKIVSELLDTIKILYNSTPEPLKPTLRYNSRSEISFPKINSKIIVLPSSENVGRGLMINNLLVTELSSWEKADEKFAGLVEGVPKKGIIIIESCVTGDTMVFTNNGPKYVKDIHDWKNNKLGFSNGKNIFIDGHYGLKPTNTYYNSGIQKGFKIKTIHGYELGMSSIHKLFVLRKDRLIFVKAEELNVGDKMVIKYGQELWGKNDNVNWTPKEYEFNKKWLKQFNPNKITSDLAYLIGLILGDGYVHKNKYVIITNIDEDVTNFLLNNNLGLKFYQDKDNYYHYRCTNQSFIEFLRKYIGFKEGDKARKKEIPKIVLSWSRDNVVAFLQGLFDADGSCSKDRNLVSFTSTSKKIINVLQYLLLNFGIISTVYPYISKPSKRVKVSSSGYRLEIKKSHSIIFLEKIGFRIKRKQNNKGIVSKNYEGLQVYIPGIGKVLKEKMKILGLKYSDISSGLNRGFYSESGNVTYRTLNKILDKCRNKECEEYKRIKELYDYGYFYDEIKDIISIEEQVYDFTVNDGHTVVYNGFVGHQTPRGVGNLYHRLWMMENEYVKKKYGWWWGYTKEEMDIKKRSMGPQMFAQEYGLEFLASGRSVFEGDIIKRQRKNMLKVGDVRKEEGKEDFVVYKEDGWTIYREPEKDGLYVCGADISEGIQGGDYSVAIIWNRKTGEEVAMWRGLVAPDRFGEILNKKGREYNNALMVPEVNNHGLTTITILKQLIYPSMYFRPAKIETMGVTSTDRMGWKTTKVTRPLMIDDFIQMARDDDIVIHSKILLDEMSVFVYDDAGNMVPQAGFHDDSIFSASIGLQGFKILYKGKLDQLNHENYLPKNFAY